MRSYPLGQGWTKEDMERAVKPEETTDKVSEDILPGDANQLHDMAIDEMEDQQDLLATEELVDEVRRKRLRLRERR